MSKNSHKQKVDYEYERKGSCSIFMFTETPVGRRYAAAFPQRTGKDWATLIKWLSDEKYPKAKKVALVMDNLNTHGIHSLYKVFQPDEAFRLAQRLEIHYTPKHGSWLNIAEIELSALTVQCLLGRRIPSIDKLNGELSAWYNSRNMSQKGVDWQFTAADARIKLKHVYPVVVF